MESIEEPIPLTAPQIATAHFTRELEGHASAQSEAETVVILHDACYGHRYSRLKTTKASLSMIVERPERIHASVLGASTAYVRLGGHHSEGKQAPHPDQSEVRNPPFKIRRSNRSMDITSSYVTNVHGTAWMSELQGLCKAAPEKLAAGTKELSRESTPGEPEKQKLHEGDLYLAPESLNAFQGALGGVADAVDTVFSPGSTTKKAFVAVRPPGHHCSADHPSGFCWLNNVHVGIEYAAQTHGLTHAAILDFDLHHGDGSQAITWERNSKNNVKRQSAKANSKLRLGPDIGYYSIHDINSYPCEMGDDEKVQTASLCIENAHGQSIWNVHLQTWKTEDEFWRLYEERYMVLLEKARIFLEHHNKRLKAEGKVRPKAAIFISAGFDASEWEGSGMQRHKVNVPTEFYARFTQDVVKLAQEIESCEGRVISVLEGGYSDRALCSGVLSHLSGLCSSPVSPEVSGLGGLMSQMNGLSINGLGQPESWRYEKEWWSAANLTALENKVNPPPPPQEKKARAGKQPTYATPTESFAYKVIDPQKFARSVSGTMREGSMSTTRPATPPPPEVDWITATQELSKLLIPVNRQTKSCTPEELAVPKAKKERHSDVSTMPIKDSGAPRQLRDRRAKGPIHAEGAHSDESRSVSRAESRASRRETISVLPSDESGAGQQRRASRRLSAGSALGTPPAVDENPPPMPSMPSAMAPGQAKPTTMKPATAAAPNPQANNKKVRPPATRKVTAPSLGSVPSTKSADSSAPSSRPATSHGAAAAPAAKTSDVDNLASGMKKITLKVSGTKEEHDKKQKEKLDAERRARALKGAETRRVNAAAKKAAQDNKTAPPRNGLTAAAAPPTANPAAAPQVSGLPVPIQTAAISPEDPMQDVQATKDAGPAVPTVPDAESDIPQRVAMNDMPSAQATMPHDTAPGWKNAPAQLPGYPDNSQIPQPFQPVETKSSLPVAAPASAPAPAPGAAGTGYRAQPAMTAVPSSTPNPPPSWPIMPQQAPMSQIPQAPAPLTAPNMGSSSPTRPASSRGNLPVFSSTGYIPFAPMSGGLQVEQAHEHQKKEEKENTSVWDVPETPAK